GIFVVHSFFFVAIDEGRPVDRRVHHVLDIGVGDGFAEEVTRFDGGINGVALQDAWGGGDDLHFVFRLLVFLDVKAAGGLIALTAFAADADGVVAESGINRKDHIAVNGAVGGDGERSLQDRLAGR